MLICSKEINTFNLKIGGHINLKESFFILNAECQQNYYFHINEQKVAGKLRTETVVEVNAGLQPTRFKAKLFLPALEHPDIHLDDNIDEGAQHDKDLDPEDKIIASGDIIRVYHKESKGHLQTPKRLSDGKIIVPPYPDFLLRQIKKLQTQSERYDDGTELVGEDEWELKRQDERERHIDISTDNEDAEGK